MIWIIIDKIQDKYSNSPFCKYWVSGVFIFSVLITSNLLLINLGFRVISLRGLIFNVSSI